MMAVMKPTMVSGMDIVAKKNGWKCESRAVKATVDYFCSQHNSCTMNDELALVEGERKFFWGDCLVFFRVFMVYSKTFILIPNFFLKSVILSFPSTITVTYYGLYDIEGATRNDNLIIDAYATLKTPVGYKYHMALMEMQSVPVCAMVKQQNNYNNNNNYDNNNNNNNNKWYNYNNYFTWSSCPKDGTYTFKAKFALDKPNSSFLSWFLTGYHGEATVDFYLERSMDLVGRCHIPMKTKPTLPIPSGMIVTLLSVVGLFIYAGLCLYSRRLLCCWGNNNRRTKTGKDDKEEKLISVPYEHEFGKKIDLVRKKKAEKSAAAASGSGDNTDKKKQEAVVDLVLW